MPYIENGIYYPKDYDEVADIPEDMKKMAESVDKALKNNKYDDTKIKQDISDIQQEQEKQNTNITELQTEIKELEEDLKANSIINKTEQEKYLYIDDSSGARSKLSVSGNVEQENSVQSKNYFTGRKINSGSSVGITYNFDNSILKFNGTSTGSGNVISDVFTGVKLPAGTYTFTVNKIAGSFQRSSGQDFALYLRNKNDFITGSYTDSGITGSALNISNPFSRKITIDEETDLYFRLFFSGSGIVINELELEVQIEPGEEFTGFEQFTPNTPSIDYPSPVKCLGDNKQLFNIKEFCEDSNNSQYYSYTDRKLKILQTDSRNEGFTYYIDVIAQEKFTLSFKNNANIRIYDKNNVTPILNQNNINTCTFISLTGQIAIKFISPNTYPYEIEDIKLEQGETPTSYSSNGQGSTEIDKINKNLYNPVVTNGTKNGITYSIDEKGVVLLNGTATAQTDIYIISTDLKNKITRVQGKIVSFKANNSSFSLYGQVTGKRYIKDGENLLTETEKEITSSFLRIPADTVCNNLKVYPQIEIGKITEYAEHQEESYILDIQQEMLKGDYFDLDRKKEVHNWEKYIITGNENWTQLNSVEGWYEAFCSEITGEINSGSSIVPNVKSNMFLAKSLNTMFSQKISGIGARANGNIVIAFDSSYDITSISSFKAKLQELYNAGTPVEIWYKLATPTEIDLTESQIEVSEKLNKLRFYKGVNNIFTLEDIALLQAEYSQDPKMYIDNKTSNIEKQLNTINELLSTTETKEEIQNKLDVFFAMSKVSDEEYTSLTLKVEEVYVEVVEELEEGNGDEI